MFVYVIVCSETLKIYIGKTISRNLNLYFQKKLWDAEHPEKSRGRSHLFSAIRKHGRHRFSIHPLMHHSTNDDLCYWERHFIKILKSQHPDVGYNICGGGEGQLGNKCALGCKHSPEAIRRTVEGCRNSLTWYKGRIPWNKGKRISNS